MIQGNGSGTATCSYLTSKRPDAIPVNPKLSCTCSWMTFLLLRRTSERIAKARQRATGPSPPWPFPPGWVGVGGKASPRGILIPGNGSGTATCSYLTSKRPDAIPVNPKLSCTCSWMTFLLLRRTSERIAKARQRATGPSPPCIAHCGPAHPWHCPRDFAQGPPSGTLPERLQGTACGDPGALPRPQGAAAYLAGYRAPTGCGACP